MTSPSDDISDFVNPPPKLEKPRRGFPFLQVLFFVVVLGFLIALYMPVTRSARPAARRAQCVSDLKQIAMALRNYESKYNAFPPAYTVDPAGRPLHSWRTLILPYLDFQSLYESIDLSKPWNDPANAKAYATPLYGYSCPSADCPATSTCYLAVVGPNACFLPDRPRRLSEITDDRSLTLMVIEVPSDRSVHWMAPIDADESLVMAIDPRSKVNHVGGMNAAFVDGSVQFLRDNIPAARRRALISIAGNDDKVALDH